MKRSNFFYCNLLALTLPLFAMANHGGKHFDQGFYFGGAAGMSKMSADIHQDLSVVYDGFEGAPRLLGNLGASYDEDKSSGMGQVQLGYAIAWEWLFVGLEVSVNGSDLGIEHDTQIFAWDGFEGLTGLLSSHSNIDLNNFEPVADLKLGFTMAARTYLYARVGAAFNTIEVKDHITFTQYLLGDPFEGEYSLFQGFAASDSDSVVGLRLGAGIEHKFFDRVSVALDYVHTDYGSVSASAFQPTKLFSDTMYFEPFVSVYDKVDVARDVVTLGVNYYFW